MAHSPLDSAAPADGRSRGTRHQAPSTGWPALALFCIWGAGTAQAQRSCDAWSAELTAVEGVVEVQRNEASPAWLRAASGDRVCTGDTVRVQAASRATLTLPDRSMIRIAENSTLVLPEPASGDGSLLEILRGLIHVISRNPRSLNFKTPYLNAGLEGTEFDIRVSEAERQTAVAVLEGAVSITTPAGALQVGSQHLAVAKEGEAPTATPLPSPIELMRWASYYPAIIDGTLPQADQPPSPNEERAADFFARRAAARLRTARVDAAESDLATALDLVPAHATALAVRAMLALARSDLSAAQQDTAGAIAADGRSVPALIARSHVQQASNDLTAAERTLERALEIEGDNAIVLTRLAELALARGDLLAAIERATRAQSLAPTSAAPPVVLGFAHIGARETRAAQTAFERAARLEPEAPLPRIGLALAAAQDDDLLEARRQLEIAVNNDPANALTRSYMAKLYETEHRGELTTSQLDLAKSFDPADPTPWLYSALQQLRANRVVEALQDLRAATDRNGGRAVFRSRLLLDEDLATRSAALGRVHTEAGFGRLALVDGWQAVVDDPDNHAGHRLLTDLYAFEPRHEIARVSELLVSQLLQPINMTPVKPQLAQPSSFLAQRTGPSTASFDEFTSPVASNGLKLLASSVGGSNGTRGMEVAAAGLGDRVAYGAGHYRFQTDGFRSNNDFDQRITNGFVQFQPSYDLNLQAELRSVRADYGDLAIRFDPSLYSPIQRSAEQSDSLRLGAKRRLADSGLLLASMILQDTTSVFDEGDALDLDTDRQSYSVDVQYLRELEGARTQTGLVYARQDDRLTTSFSLPGMPEPFVTTQDTEQRQVGLYAYAHLDLSPALTLTIGGSVDRIDDTFVEKDGINPKLGMTWRPSERTTVRAAAFRTLFGSLTTSVQNPQPRLEPVQLAGFTQLLFGGTADVADVRGVAVDHEFTERVFVGWETSVRETDRPVLTFTDPLNPVTEVALSERVQQGYFYWTPSDRFSVSAKLEKGRYTSEPIQVFGYARLKAERLPIEVRYFAPTGFTIGVRATDVHQSGWFQAPGPSPFEPSILVPGADRFWTLDAFVAYRLPKRRGSLSLNADNLLDEQFQFQDIDPTNPGLFPERMISVRFTLAFD